MTKKPAEGEINFEKAFTRLEEILETMNSGKASLDDSLALYEEADKLIIACGKRLTDAENKIEVLMKNRAGELALDPSGRPMTEDGGRLGKRHRQGFQYSEDRSMEKRIAIRAA